MSNFKENIHTIIKTYKPTAMNRKNIDSLIYKGFYDEIMDYSKQLDISEPKFFHRLSLILEDKLSLPTCEREDCNNIRKFGKKFCSKICQDKDISEKQKHNFSTKKDEILRKRNITRKVNEKNISSSISTGIKLYYKNLNERIEMADILELDDVEKRLKESDLEFSNRNISKMLKEYDVNLYKSILHYVPDDICYSKKITEKIYKILNHCIFPVYCISCSTNLIKFQTYEDPYIKSLMCKKCSLKQPKYEYITLTSGIEKANSWSKNISTSRKGYFTKKWFIGKYGYEVGVEKFKSKMLRWHSKDKTYFRNHIGHAYSKISQTLFEMVLEHIEEKDEVFFASHGGEKIIDVSGVDTISNSSHICLDFIYKNSIIEYDCDMYHIIKNDSNRDDYLRSIGYEVLRINHTEFKPKHKRREVVKRCLEFLEIDNDL